MTWSVRLLVGRLVGRSVCHNFLSGGKFHFHTPIGALLLDLLFVLQDIGGEGGRVDELDHAELSLLAKALPPPLRLVGLGEHAPERHLDVGPDKPLELLGLEELLEGRPELEVGAKVVVGCPLARLIKTELKGTAHSKNEIFFFLAPAQRK